MKHVFVNSGESKVLSWGDGAPALATFDLSDGFAVTAFNAVTKTAGITRNIESTSIEQFIRSLMPSDDMLLYPLLEVRIMGGGADVALEKKLKDILTAIQKVDDGRNLIRIVSADTYGKSYPNSFKILCFNGKIEIVDRADVNNVSEQSS